MIRGVRPLRLQAYAALTASFARIFFVNLTASRVPGDIVSPAVFTVLPIAAICFYVWWRLLPVENETGRWPIHNTIAWFGTVAIAALLYFQAVPIWVVCWWSGLAMILLAAALWLRQEVFLHQAVALAAGAFAHGTLHNVFGGSYFMQSGWRGSFGVLVLGCALLLAGLPLAFRLRSRLVQEPMQSGLARRLGVHRPEQWFFFAPALLLVFLIAIKMNPGMVTLSWGMEGALMILLGLAVGERSYRLTGLLLLLVCVGKIVCLDAGTCMSATATSPSLFSARHSQRSPCSTTAIARRCGGCCETHSRPIRCARPRGGRLMARRGGDGWNEQTRERKILD